MPPLGFPGDGPEVEQGKTPTPSAIPAPSHVAWRRLESRSSWRETPLPTPHPASKSLPDLPRTHPQLSPPKGRQELREQSGGPSPSPAPLPTYLPTFPRGRPQTHTGRNAKGLGRQKEP